MIVNKKEFKLLEKKTPVSLLPNALTILGVCLGLSSIKFALDLNYEMAVIAIGLAAVLDTLDGRVARLIKGTSKVGKELDSLTDVISFGVAPSFIIYFWTLNNLGKFGWMLVLIYTVCCALRLARFNLTNINQNETWKINFFRLIEINKMNLIFVKNIYMLRVSLIYIFLVITLTYFFLFMTINYPNYFNSF